MTTETITETDRVLAEMLTENTGRHMLDSGGAYGRNWERNQGRTVEDWLSEDEATMTSFGPRFSTFHYLRYKLDYAPDVDAVFQGFVDAPARKDDSYFDCVYEWCEMYDRAYTPSFLTYNMEGECLSQGFQADNFRYKGEDYCCLSIHGGCDIRGGYTRPRVFRIVSDMFGGDLDSYTLYSEGRKGDKVTLEVRCCELIEPGGASLSNDDPLARWASFWHREGEEGYPVWDKEAERWKAPDGDGYIGVEADFPHNP